MHQHQIANMVQILLEDGAIEDAERVSKLLQGCWGDRIAIVWDVEDVQIVCPDLTDEQAMEVLRAVLHNHDADQGVNWGTIRRKAEEMFGAEACGTED